MRLLTELPDILHSVIHIDYKCFTRQVPDILHNEFHVAYPYFTRQNITKGP